MVLRIRFSSEKATYKLGKKFGCDPLLESSTLLTICKSLKLNVIGLSFHIGSSCIDYEVYRGAIQVSKKVFKLAEEIGYSFNFLDIGGGFPGDNFDRVKVFSKMINEALNKEFPIVEFPKLEVISEPGRYFVESAFILATNIHSKKITFEANGEIENIMYYLTEGVYGSFLFVPIGPEEVLPHIMDQKKKKSNKMFKSTLWGPTCDSTDKLCVDIEMPQLEIHDWIYFKSMGAYTITLASNFNGFPFSKVHAYISKVDR